ncbi:MAG: SBBP repeat-containing protein [Planctomycetota bacterium]|nr:SBBP repeat-containing protein [Planctomycetota bacterium]
MRRAAALPPRTAKSRIEILIGAVTLGIVGFVILGGDIVGQIGRNAPGFLRSAGAETADPNSPLQKDDTLLFWANEGQIDPQVRYYTQGRGFGFYFTPEEVGLQLAKGDGSHGLLSLGLELRDASPEVRVEGRRRDRAKAHFYVGKDPSNWRTDVTAYREVVYRDLWPGVDGAFRGEDGKLKYEFIVSPGGSVGSIRLAYRGAKALSIDERGDLRIETSQGTISDKAPTAYQEIDGKQVEIPCRYVLDASKEAGYRFAIQGPYDREEALVIDPSIAYSTYLGGNSIDEANGVALDGSGNAYVTGFTFSSSNFPGNSGGASSFDAFVTALNPAGAVLWTAFVGGSSAEFGLAIAVDSAGQPTIAGTTLSADFPATAGASDELLGGFVDAFVARLSSDGSALIYATYLGGSGGEQGCGIALDASGSAYVIGSTDSADFPTTVGAFDTVLEAGNPVDVYVAKLSPDGSSISYATYLGGSSFDTGCGISVDANGNACVAGFTLSDDFPTVSALDSTLDGGQDAFVTRLDPSGSALVYSTYLGGDSFDAANGVAVDTAGNTYVVGRTRSSDFPTTASAFQTALAGSGSQDDAFVTKLSPAGALVYSSYLGGSASDQGIGVAVASSGDAYVTGQTFSSDFPLEGALDSTRGGAADGFIARLNATGSSLAFSSYLGGDASLDAGRGVAVDPAGNFVVVGCTSSSDYPTSAGAADTSFEGGREGFVVRYSTGGAASGQVDIDIKPDGEPNPIRPGSTGVVPVAILSSDTFDATTVDPATITLAGAGVKTVGKGGRLLAHHEDVNGDGLLDLLCQIVTAEMNLDSGATTATLEAMTFDGLAITGEDTVKIIQ